MDGILQGEILQFFYLRGIVEENHSVAHQDTHQRHKAEDGGHGDGHSSEEDTHRRTKDTERQTYHDEYGFADTLEVPQQHKEDDGNRDDQSTGNLRGGILIIIILATYFHLHTIGQLETF